MGRHEVICRIVNQEGYSDCRSVNWGEDGDGVESWGSVKRAEGRRNGVSAWQDRSGGWEERVGLNFAFWSLLSLYPPLCPVLGPASFSHHSAGERAPLPMPISPDRWQVGKPTAV